MGGFRVPLVVVSAYNYRPQGKAGYISGVCVAPGNCPNEKPPYIHDFGSILNFIEYAFGTSGNPLGGTGGISPSYPYADHFAPDGHIVYPPNSYSLSTSSTLAAARAHLPRLSRITQLSAS
jgi:hypothetical protein